MTEPGERERKMIWALGKVIKALNTNPNWDLQDAMEAARTIARENGFPEPFCDCSYSHGDPEEEPSLLTCYNLPGLSGVVACHKTGGTAHYAKQEWYTEDFLLIYDVAAEWISYCGGTPPPYHPAHSESVRFLANTWQETRPEADPDWRRLPYGSERWELLEQWAGFADMIPGRADLRVLRLRDGTTQVIPASSEDAFLLSGGISWKLHVSLSAWSLKEACHLVCAVRPGCESWRVDACFDAARRALAVGDLAGTEEAIRPRDFIAWARRIGVEIPPPLQVLVDEQTEPAPATSTQEPEKATSKRRGRPAKYDPDRDRDLYEAWERHKHDYTSAEDFCLDPPRDAADLVRGMDGPALRNAIDRHKKRRERPSKNK